MSELCHVVDIDSLEAAIHSRPSRSSEHLLFSACCGFPSKHKINIVSLHDKVINASNVKQKFKNKKIL